MQQSVFYGKRWIAVVQSVTAGLFALFILIYGPLFLLGIIKGSKEPDASAFASLCLLAVCSLALFGLTLFHLKLLKRPLLRICKEGLLWSSTIAASKTSQMPFGIFHSLQILIAAKSNATDLCIPWEDLKEIRVIKLLTKSLLVRGVFKKFSSGALEVINLSEVSLVDAIFKDDLNTVAASITAYSNDKNLAAMLPSWQNSEVQLEAPRA